MPEVLLPSLEFANRSLSLGRPVIMGILNITPDSFSDGGNHTTLASATQAARRMLDEGADIIDVGGESTRPGAAAVSAEEELRRVVPLVSVLAEAGMLVSVDTSKPEVMRASIEAGAFMVNDVRALQDDGALEAMAETGAPVCLMHMQGEPRTMQKNPHYDDVVAEVADFLRQRMEACIAAGIKRDKLVVDPGFGFGKSTEHNLCLLNQLASISQLGAPVLVGLSRKSLFAAILSLKVQDRLHASVAAALMAVERGANIVRVHDVRETAHALGVFSAVMTGQPRGKYET